MFVITKIDRRAGTQLHCVHHSPVKKEPAVSVPAGANVGTAKIPIPIFAIDRFLIYMDKIEMRKEVCGQAGHSAVAPTAQGLVQ